MACRVVFGFSFVFCVFFFGMNGKIGVAGVAGVAGVVDPITSRATRARPTVHAERVHVTVFAARFVKKKIIYDYDALFFILFSFFFFLFLCQFSLIKRSRRRQFRRNCVDWVLPGFTGFY